jgi:hypothetical protein
VGIALVLGVYFMSKLKDKERILFITSLFMFIYFYPKAVEGRFMNKLVINRDLRSVYTFVEAQKEINNLYIYNRPGQLIPLNLGAVNHNYAKKNWKKLKRDLKLGLYSNVYVLVQDKYKDPEYKYFKDDVTQLENHKSTSKKSLKIYKMKLEP